MPRSTSSCAATPSRTPPWRCLKTAFKPTKTVVKEHLRAGTMNERTWEIASRQEGSRSRRQGATGGVGGLREYFRRARATVELRAPVYFTAPLGRASGGPAMVRWVEETFHPHWRVRLEAARVLHEVKTAHQHLVIFENPTWGTVLMLDGVCQLTTSDEFVYHEMMAHVPLMALARPRRVLVVGGGDGGVLREVLEAPVGGEGDAVRDRPRRHRPLPEALSARSPTAAWTIRAPTSSSPTG